MEHEPDHIDKKIISILQKNARTPIKEIAKEVYLSSPAVSARISTSCSISDGPRHSSYSQLSLNTGMCRFHKALS